MEPRSTGSSAAPPAPAYPLDLGGQRGADDDRAFILALETGCRVLLQIGFGLDPLKARTYAEEWERCFRELTRYIG
jgi:hypothetical protein